MTAHKTRLVYVVPAPEQIVRVRIPAGDYADALEEPGVFRTFAEARNEALAQIEISIAEQMRSIRYLRKMKAAEVEQGWTDNIYALLGN